MDRKMNTIINSIAETVVKAGSGCRPDMLDAYRRAIENETKPQTKAVLEMIIENMIIADNNRSPICDDTGIPHLFLEIGRSRQLSGDMLEAIHLGISKGLRMLPGRPMAIIGNDVERLDQSGGLSDDPGDVLPSPILIRTVNEDIIRLTIIMQGGGPAIRAKTYRVFHQHSIDTVKDEIINWATEAAVQLGCTPCTLAVGIGRSHFEAAALMMEAQVYGNFNVQSELEKEITAAVNQSNVGALGLRGKTTALASFIKIGPQRASGVRIVCMRPCCCYEPRIGSVELL